jgi:hypothetical protein
MLFRTKRKFFSKEAQGGHGYDHFEYEAMCSKCLNEIASLEYYPSEKAELGLNKGWKNCPFCGEPLYEDKNKEKVEL